MKIYKKPWEVEIREDLIKLQTRVSLTFKTVMVYEMINKLLINIVNILNEVN